MTFDPNAQLDPTSVTDARGSGRIGGRGAASPSAAAGSASSSRSSTSCSGATPVTLRRRWLRARRRTRTARTARPSRQCKTGADANNREDCQIVGYVNSIEAYWGGALQGYYHAETVLFSEGVSTGCGDATSATGPFYCPADKHVYLDLTFFQELQDRFGAKDAPFARAYVLAHEYGHHVQDLVGDLKPGGNDSGATGRSVRTELQADCYAGVWAHSARRRLDPAADGGPDPAADAAAAAVGDDHIQQQSSGGRPRQLHPRDVGAAGALVHRATSGEPSDCDTFNATSL